MTRSTSALGIGALLFAACAGRLAPAFDSRLADSDAAATAALLGSLPHDAQPRAQDALLVATTAGAQPELLLYELDHARVRWRLPLKADARPELLGDLVVTVSHQRLMAFDARNGHLRFESATGDCTYLGATRVGTRLFYVCEQAQVDLREPPMTKLQALDVATGRKLWLRSARGGLGRPAAVGNLVLVPWQQQSLAILDAASGRELQRVRSRDDVIDWVRADEGGVYFGQRTIYRLSSAGYSGTRQGARFVAVPAEDLPGRPVAMESAFFPHPGSRSARGRIALYLEPEAVGEDGVRIARGRYDFVFYRYLFGFDEHGGLRYCRLLPHDAIAGQAVAAGLVLAFDTGTTALISPEDGSTLAQTEVGTDLASATFDASGLRAPSAATRTAPALGRCLTEIALDTDNRLVPARAYAVAQLGKLEDPTVTVDLLDIYGQSSTPPEIERVVADALRARRTGLEHLIDALAQRYDFLEQTRPAPLAVIVPPLIEAHERRAVPRLVERMFDHETPIAVLPLVVRAVSELGDDGVIEPLAAFLRLYRADSTFAAEPEALLEACRGILAHGGQRGEALLQDIAGDGRAQPALARGAAALLDARHAERAPRVALASAANEPQAAPLPAKLSQQAVDATFAEHAADLRTCVLAARERNPKLAQVRIAFIAESDGSTHALTITPNASELQDCLYSKVASYRFPRFQAGRELQRFVLSVQPAPAESAQSEQPAAEEERFWSFYAARPRPSTVAPPWWSSQQSFLPLSTQPPTRSVDARSNASHPVSAQAEAPSPSGTVVSRGVATHAPATQQLPAAQPKTAQPNGAQPPPAVQDATEDSWWTPATPAH